METPTLSPAKNYSSSVDTSRPFRSVKEAVAIFGERILVGEIYSPKPYFTPSRGESDSWRFSLPISPNGNPKEDEQTEFMGTLKKLEAELEETKAELKLLRERESETEIAVASLNAELHKNMSRMAEAEAAAAKKAATRVFEREKKEDAVKEEERKRDQLMMIRMEDSSPTLAQILSLGEEKGYFGEKKERNKVMKKKKPIVPLVGDLFFKKKKASDNTLDNPLYASPANVF